MFLHSTYHKSFFSAVVILLLAASLPSRAEKSIYIPDFMGTLRARYEYLPSHNLSAFKVRTLRIGVDGYVAPVMRYNLMVDFSDWGKIKLVNAFVGLTPVKGLSLNLGQQRMPFSLSAHRLTCEQFFVNRNFVAKYGGIRDVGFMAGYSFPKIPLTLQASVFNCSGVDAEKHFFTNTYGFSAKAFSKFLPNWYATASTARIKRGTAFNQDWDVGAFFDNGLWHVEAEYMRKNYAHGVFTPVNAFDFFAFRNFPIEKHHVAGISGAIRYDYMSDHSTGTPSDEGILIADHPECHRLTLGTTLAFMTKFQAEIRLNYEQYFYRKSVVPPLTDDNKLVLEVIAHF